MPMWRMSSAVLVYVETQRGPSNVLLETTPAAKLVRSSISQAIGALVGQGLLAYCPMVSNDDRQTFGQEGYVLTANGLVVGLPHENAVADLDYRLWLLRRRRRPEPSNPDWWNIPAFVPAP
jgi:hypothetical protein